MEETGQCSGIAPGGRLSPERACWGMLSAPELRKSTCNKAGGQWLTEDN